MNDELLPCPFCGNTAMEYTDAGLDIIECSSCSCTLKADSSCQDTFSDALYEAWNTRFNPLTDTEER